MRATMNVHVLMARCLDGRLLEIGLIGSAETAARLLRALEAELGEEYLSFSVHELEIAPTVRGLRYDEAARADRTRLLQVVRH